MKTKIRARLRPRVDEAIGFPEEADAIILWYPDTARERMAELKAKIAEVNADREKNGEEPVEIDVCIDFVRKRRSIRANNLMWALYEIIASALNKENRTRKPITPQDLYNVDMKAYAPKATFPVPTVWAEAIAHEIEHGEDPDYESLRGRVIERIRRGEETILTVWRTSSFWNTKEMAEHIDRILQDIADMGITRERDGGLDAVFEDYEKWKRSIA